MSEAQHASEIQFEFFLLIHLLIGLFCTFNIDAWSCLDASKLNLRLRDYPHVCMRGDATPTSAAAITFHKNDFMHISAMKNFSSIILYDLRLSHSHRTTDGRTDEKAALKSVYTILREYYTRRTARTATPLQNTLLPRPLIFICIFWHGGSSGFRQDSFGKWQYSINRL